ncbi:hypothetical protein DMC30DRAFT_392583 [Rhodotorula diobovata]|uniref:Uncharacterized protein n=1 Tax=Rhodotorula diobovata TaxID=5288 RepID=A0A5C5FZM7_9BASI|nr:hypothetical protein DMC30DRAFT_392583 [Rhodotorula diobovata]
MQVVNANAFIATGLIRVLMGATSGGMARYDTMFLWPQALGFIFIMVPAILAPNWSRVGLSQKDMEERMRKEAKTSPTNARRSDVRAVEAALYKKHHDRWSLPILAFWIINMSAWTGLYAWVSLADIEFSQANCEGEAVLDMTLTPTVVSASPLSVVNVCRATAEPSVTQPSSSALLRGSSSSSMASSSCARRSRVAATSSSTCF